MEGSSWYPHYISKYNVVLQILIFPTFPEWTYCTCQIDLIIGHFEFKIFVTRFYLLRRNFVTISGNETISPKSLSFRFQN